MMGANSNVRCRPVRQRRIATGGRPARGAWIAAAILLAAGLVGAARADDPQNCLFCHRYRGLGRLDTARGDVHLFHVSADYTEQRLGPHARVACVDCHPLDEVGVVPHRPVTRVDCTQTCHLRDPGGLPREFTHVGTLDLLRQSVHTPEILEKLDFAGGPLLEKGQSLCLYCHDEPLFRDPGSLIPGVDAQGARTFDRCDSCHAEQIPVDVRYYLRHVTSRLRSARPPLEMAQVCAVCHSNAQVRAAYSLPDSVASFVRSFHGKAALLGDERTADCVSCHVAGGANAHLMLGPQQAASAVSPARVADSCRSVACHPGADKALAAAGVHLDLTTARGSWEYALAALFIFLTITTFGPSMLIVVLELWGLVVGRQHHGGENVEQLAARVWAHPEGRRRLTRFTFDQRVQHWVLVILFVTLASTGFPMKFADQGWARAVISTLGGLDVARRIHHWAGVALVVGFTGHILAAARHVIVSRRLARAAQQRLSLAAAVQALPMWVTPRDGLKMLQLLGYLLHLRKHPPAFGRFSVTEKFEYIGVFWGTTLLGVTGALLWGASYFTQYISGRFLNLALIAHTYEAFLAIIHVGILHIVNVIFKPNVFPLSPAMFTGRTPLAELAAEHSDQVQGVARELGIATEGGASHV